MPMYRPTGPGTMEFGLQRGRGLFPINCLEAPCHACRDSRKQSEQKNSPRAQVAKSQYL